MNIQAALAYLKTIPANRWAMYMYGVDDRGCALGHLARWKDQEELRFRNGAIVLNDRSYYGAQYIALGSALFGLDPETAEYLFGPITREERWSEEPLVYLTPEEARERMTTDKGIFFNRVNKLGLEAVA